MALSLGLLNKWISSKNKKALLQVFFKPELKNCSKEVAFKKVGVERKYHNRLRAKAIPEWDFSILLLRS